jgi:hypothetical protein
MQTRIFLLAFFIITSWSCKKTKVITTGFDNSAKVIATISGIVQNELGLPMAGVKVKCENNIRYSSYSGAFSFDSVLVHKNAQLVQFESPNYFKNYRTILTQEKTNNFTIIKMSKKENPTIFNTIAGAIIIQKGVTLELPRQGYKNKATGKFYEGQVTAFVKPLLTDSEDFLMSMPGDLRGIDSSNQEMALISMGMLGVELEDASGNPLQLANNTEAKISMPIAANQQATAPQIVPLWHFDETKAMWVEEGEAIRKGNSYEGKVNHFSWWNIDIGFDADALELTVVDASGNPIPTLQVKLNYPSPIGSQHRFTNYSGKVLLPIMKNTTHTLTINSNQCATTLYTSNFTTTNVNMNLGNINLGLTAPVAVIKGTFVDCNNIPIPNAGGYITDNNNGYGYPITSDNFGNFVCSTPVCGGTKVIDLYGYDSSQYGKSSITVAQGLNNIGNLPCCGYWISKINYSCTIDSFAFSTIDSNAGWYYGTMAQPFWRFGDNIASTNSGSLNRIIGATNQAYNYPIYPYPSFYLNNLEFIFNGSNVGNFNIVSIKSDNSTLHNYLVPNQTHYYKHTHGVSSTICNVPVTITEFSQVPNQGYIKGNFSGTFYDSVGHKLKAVGDFIVERNF